MIDVVTAYTDAFIKFSNEWRIVLVVSKIMYGDKIMNLITSSFCRAVARHSAPRARPGDAESTDLSTYRGFRPFKFEFHAWVLTEHDRCDDRRM